MHFTLHVTADCNMRCSYCYSPLKNRSEMSDETLSNTLDFASTLSPENTGIIFFGGEPLLKRKLIEYAVDECKKRKDKHGYNYHFKITTNGMLLDDCFLEFAEVNRVIVALSFDGVKNAHDACRSDLAGSGTFEKTKEAAILLLKYQPFASVLMTLNPETIEYYFESVEFLHKLGFRYIIASMNYAGSWQDKHLKVLKREYKKLAAWYERSTIAEKKFYFSPFEMKIASHIKGEEYKCFRCALGKKQVSIGPDGTIYPCVQFVKDGISNKDYSIGHVKTGFDGNKRNKFYKLSQKTDDECEKCALKVRCNNSCSCLNWQTTGKFHKVSDFLCEHERILFPIVDKTAEKLYRLKTPMFIQKHYNPEYPLLSLIDESL